MLYKATVSFSGIISMASGEIREISDPVIAADLLKAGHIIEHKLDEQPKAEKKERKGKTK